jgi:hypothetical protein
MTAHSNSRQQFIGLLLLTGFSAAAFAGKIYQWTDWHGQVHFGDNPPASAETTEALPLHPRTPVATGLRPGEIAALQALEQRTDRQQRRTRTARRRSEQQQIARRAACRAQRQQLHSAPGKDGFKKHAHYLRIHCW